MKIFFALVPALFFAPGPALAAGPAAAPKADFSVREIGPLLVPSRSSFPVVGQGGNYSLALGEGKTLWLLNNIWTGELKEKGEVSLWGVVDGGLAVSESTSPYAAGAGLSYTVDENRWPLPLLTAEAADYSPVRKFWPRAGVRTSSGCFVFYSLMNNYGPQVYDNFRVGQGLAFSADPAGHYGMLQVGGRYAFWNDIEPAFGSALWPDRDGWVYVYGRVMTEPGKYSAALARVLPEDLADRDRYAYYSPGASSGPWTADAGEAAAVLEDMPDEFSVSYNEHLKKYLALYSGAEGGVLLRTGDYPWGPWTAPRSALACRKEEYCYGGKEQAAFSSEGGRRIFFTVEKKNLPRLYELEFK
ncbi:MAG: hypothetical protein A3J79_05275 [Elusimicrobia bacterium RIFOXYB2_FULL_62_6]|nr:MAG: hypothetical protein A3J79_05275 [Elusimicrobia bacterium RIFOXYB2_FULL_62_6]